MIDTYDYECICIVDTLEECHDWFDRTDFILTDADIEALKQGKIINASVNREYAITLRMAKEGE